MAESGIENVDLLFAYKARGFVQRFTIAPRPRRSGRARDGG
jgi:hypothetical protein